MRPFKIDFPESGLEEFRSRIRGSRFPMPWAEDAWQHGTDGEYIHSLLKYWSEEYDWKETEAYLNAFPQFLCEIDGVTVHFFHIRGQKPDAMPLLLTHGWPDSFLRYSKVFPLLQDFDLVVPSLPGFAFSGLPTKGFMNNAEIAHLWHKLMTQELGYESYIASGGDVGRGVTHFLAQYYPDEVRGIHLTDIGFVRSIMALPDGELSADELDYKRRAEEWIRKEGAYINIQSTKPQTLAFALADSPVALAAWLTEKYRAWSDWERFSMKDLCDALTLYWMTNSACTSVRVYHGNTFTLPPIERINVPTGITIFKYDVLLPPKAAILDNYHVIQYDEVLRGGHFTALEQPEAFASSLRKFSQSI